MQEDQEQRICCHPGGGGKDSQAESSLNDILYFCWGLEKTDPLTQEMLFYQLYGGISTVLHAITAAACCALIQGSSCLSTTVVS